MGTKYLAHVISVRNKPDTSSGLISFNTLLIPIVLERRGRLKAVALFTEERKEKGLKKLYKNKQSKLSLRKYIIDMDIHICT